MTVFFSVGAYIFNNFDKKSKGSGLEKVEKGFNKCQEE